MNASSWRRWWPSLTGSRRRPSEREGLGLGLASEFVAQGWAVTATVRSAAQQAPLQALPGVRVEQLEMTDPASLEQLAQRLSGQQFDVIFVNAGVAGPSHHSTAQASAEEMGQLFLTNAVAPLRVAEALVPLMGQGSKIANITSRMGSIGDNDSGGSYGYRMSKTALNAAGKSLAVDLKKHGIAVALLHPGWVNTEMVNFNGLIEPEEAAAGLQARMDELNLENSGGFWHSNGDQLPW